MLIGDPSNFAIITESVNAWNETKDFCEGVLLYCVDGEIFPKGELISATLGHDLHCLKNNFSNPTINEELYKMDKDAAFLEIYYITYPSDWSKNNNYCYDISPDSFIDRGCFVFAVSDGKKVRILSAHSECYNKEESEFVFANSIVKESYVDVDDFKQVSKAFDVFMEAYENDMDNLGI